MNRHSLPNLILVFAALASPALAQPTAPAVSSETGPTPDPGSSFLQRMASEIESRSQLNCDPAFDPTGRNATRQPLLSLPRESIRPDPQTGDVNITEIIASMGMTNSAHYSVCFTSALKDAPEAAVFYSAGVTRMIALNPTLSDADVEKALHKTYDAIKAGWISVNEGKIERADFEKAQPIMLTDATPSTTLPAEAPHRYFRLLHEINNRSTDNCGPERNAKETEGHRILNIGLPHLHADFASQSRVMGLLDAVNQGGYAVCFDSELHGKDELAVVYNGKARIIAINPGVPNYQDVLLLAYTHVQQNTEALAASRITQEIFDQTQTIRNNDAPAPAAN